MGGKRKTRGDSDCPSGGGWVAGYRCHLSSTSSLLSSTPSLSMCRKMITEWPAWSLLLLAGDFVPVNSHIRRTSALSGSGAEDLLPDAFKAYLLWPVLSFNTKH